MTRDPLDGAAAWAGVDREQFLAAIARANAKANVEPKLTWGQGYDPRWWVLHRHIWTVTRTADGAKAQGRAITYRGMVNARHRAYLRLLNPRPAVETSRLANRWRTWVP